jgi:hypothetical protein
MIEKYNPGSNNNTCIVNRVASEEVILLFILYILLFLYSAIFDYFPCRYYFC